MFLEPWKIHGISTTNLPQLFVRSPDLDKIPQEAVVHEIKDSSTGKKDLQRMGGMGRPGIFEGMGIFHGMVWDGFFVSSNFSKDWKVEDVFHICWVFVNWSMIDIILRDSISKS